MLQQSSGVRGHSRSEDFDTPETPEVVDFDRLLAAARRQWRVVAVCALIAPMLGFAYVLTAVPLFTASTDLLIDQSNSRIVDELSVAGACWRMKHQSSAKLSC